MDTTLRDLERRHNKGATTSDDSVKLVVAYCRSQGYQYGGNIKSRVENLWLFQSTGEAQRLFNRSVVDRHYDEREKRRKEWIRQKVKDRKHNVELTAQGQ